MTIWDDRILEIAREEDSVTPKKLDDTEYFAVSKTQISRRLRKLTEHDLMQHLGNGVYVITERGEGYLDGDISTYEDEPDRIAENGDEEEDNGVSSTGNAG
jgi:DeoR/GlpR family transcriptional regulator of sugar metabolism